MGSTEARNLVALFLQLQRAVCVCVGQRNEGSGGGFGLGSGVSSAVTAGGAGSPFPCPLEPAQRSCRGLPVPPLGFLGSNDSIRAVCSLPPPRAPPAAELFVTQSFGLCCIPGNTQLPKEPGTGLDTTLGNSPPANMGGKSRGCSSALQMSQLRCSFLHHGRS